VELGGTASALDEKEKDKRAQLQAPGAAEADAGTTAPPATAGAAIPTATGTAPPAGAAALAAAAPEAKVGDGYGRTIVLGVDMRVTLDLPNGPMSLDVTGTFRQEVRFKLTRVEHGRVAALSLVYGTCRAELSAPGRPPFSEELSTTGKAYDVEVGTNELRVSTNSHTTLSDTEIKEARSDAQSYLNLDAWLRPGDPKAAPSPQVGARLLPPPDQHFKIGDERMTFRGFEPLSGDAQKAVYDVHLGLEGSDNGILVKGTLDGTADVATASLRPLAVHANGPLTLTVSERGIPANGSGNLVLDITFTP
jgi:hypothetical protein